MAKPPDRELNNADIFSLEETIKALQRKNEILLHTRESENWKFKIMENDFLIKIDALEDQIHQLLLECDKKDDVLKQLGINANDDPKTNTISHNARKYTPKKAAPDISDYEQSYTRPDSTYGDPRPRSKSALKHSTNLPDIKRSNIRNPQWASPNKSMKSWVQEENDK